MKDIGYRCFFILHLAAIAFLVYAFGRLGGFRMPQVAAGEDVLSVAFGDAREVLSRAAVHKADSYLHGGVDMECNELHEHGDCGHCHDHPHHEKSENSTILHFSFFTFHSLSDPWAWINSHIRAPEIERHLEGEKAVELMPWFWVAVKADPHNAEAWASAWYSAKHIMKDASLAQRVLAEAKAKNPESIEIAFTEGRALYDGGKGDRQAAKAAFRRAVWLANAKCKGDTSALSPREEEAFRWAGNYLQNLDRHDK